MYSTLVENNHKNAKFTSQKFIKNAVLGCQLSPCHSGTGLHTTKDYEDKHIEEFYKEFQAIIKRTSKKDLCNLYKYQECKR